MIRFRSLSLQAAIAALSIFASSSYAGTWLFDFGPATQTSAPNYNNITSPDIQRFVGLVNTDGQTTGASLAITIPFNTGGTNSNGTTAPDASIGFVANATRDSFFGNVVAFQGHTAPNARMVLSGLDPALRYDFSFFASRLGVTDNRQTEYKVTGANSSTAYLNASENTSEVATTSGIQPAADGTIVLDLAPGSDNTNANKFFYIGAMRVTSQEVVPVACGSTDSIPDDTFVKFPYEAGVSPYNLGHWLYRPAGYSYAPCKKHPLLVWLHGSGESCPGSSLDALNAKSSLNSPGYQIAQGTAYTNHRPFLNGLILEPQTCGSWNAANIDAMIEYVKTKVRVDEDRIYVTGLSLGGGGTWAYAAGKSTKVAAIVPVAGTEASLSTINNASHVPTWAFHNYHDTNVISSSIGPATDLFRCKNHTPRECTVEHVDQMTPFATTRVMENYSLDHGATQASTDRTASLAKVAAADMLPMQWAWTDGRLPADFTSKEVMTIFAASGHGGWATAYGMQEMWQWLYAQTRQPAPTLRINSPLVAPANAGVTSGATIVVSAQIALGGVSIAKVVADLKSLGGSNVAPLTYDSVAKTYKLSHTLPASGLEPGTKAVAIVAIDVNGGRTDKYVTFTLDQ